MRTRRLGPVARTLVLTTLGMLAGLAIVIASTLTIRGTRSLAREQAARTVPAQTALRRTWEAATDGQALFLTSVQSRDPAEHATALTAAQTAGQVKDAAWAEYLRHALDRPGERALQRSYTENSAQSVKLAATLLATSPDDPTFAAKLAEERRTSKVANETLASIESRIYAPTLQQSTSAVVSGLDRQRTVDYVSFGATGLIFCGFALVLMRGYRDDERRMRTEAAEMRTEARYSNVETTLQRALEMEHSEGGVFDVIAQALTIVDSECPSELLLADSSHAHFQQVLNTAPEADAACRVGSPEECPATMSGQTQFFATSAALDTCPYLRGRTDEVWARCVPVGIAGRATGVLHMQRPIEFVAGDNGRGWELIARKLGDRLGMLRAFARSETQAHTDPLTGLLNRRSLEARTRDLTEDGLPFVVAYGDLDHFKLLNDVHGHDTGDRALRLFARVLRDSVRPNDIPARYGGEEFVVVLPDCTIDNAVAAIERVRDRLRNDLEETDMPLFTVSFGLAASSANASFGETVDAADQALLRSKRAGRDCVSIAEPHGNEPPVVASTPPAPDESSADDGAQESVGGDVAHRG